MIRRIALYVAAIAGGAVIGLLVADSKRLSPEELVEIVDAEAEFFEADEVPEGLKAVLANSEVVLLGEQHYVQEHKEYLLKLAEYAAPLGYNLILAEGMEAYSWLVEDYVLGLRDTLPLTVRYFDNYLIEGLRELNTRLPEDQRIRLAYYDINHWDGVATESLNLALKELPPGAEAYLEDLLRSRYSTLTPNMHWTHDALARGVMKEYSTELREVWGDRWYNIVYEMLPSESRDWIRNNVFDDAKREDILTSNIRKHLEEQRKSGHRTLVNTGLYHAQRKTLMGVRILRLGEALSSEAYKLFSIGFVALRGERKFSFQDEHPYQVDIPASAGTRNLIGVLGTRAGDRMAWLPTGNEKLGSGRNWVTYGVNDTHLLVPARQFDAFITYPRVTLTRSLAEFESKFVR